MIVSPFRAGDNDVDAVDLHATYALDWIQSLDIEVLLEHGANPFLLRHFWIVDGELISFNIQ